MAVCSAVVQGHKTPSGRSNCPVCGSKRRVAQSPGAPKMQERKVFHETVVWTRNSPSAAGSLFLAGVELQDGSELVGAEIEGVVGIANATATLRDCVARGRVEIGYLDDASVAIKDCVLGEVETYATFGHITIEGCAIEGPLRMSGGGDVSGSTAEVYALGSGKYLLDITSPGQIVVLHELARLDAKTHLHPDTIVVGGRPLYEEMFDKQHVRYAPIPNERKGHIAYNRGFASTLEIVQHLREHLLRDRGDSLYVDAGNFAGIDNYFEMRGTKRQGPVDVNRLALALALSPNL